MQWALQLLPYSILWEQNEISIVVCLFASDSASLLSRLFAWYLKQHIGERTTHFCETAKTFLGAILSVSFPTSLHCCMLDSFLKYRFQAVPDVLHCSSLRAWKLYYHKQASFPFPLCNSWLVICYRNEDGKEVLCTTCLFAIYRVDTDNEGETKN